MSGSAGGNRILRTDVEKTVKHYQKNVLTRYDKYQDSIITGSFNTMSKNDFGDIDIIVQLNASDKTQAKRDFVEFLITLPKNLIVPFKSIKYSGKRFLNTGEIITILYPIFQNKGFVQIDNIISLTSEETHFKNKFLTLPAIKQGLMLGLIKTVAIEDPDVVQHFVGLSALKHNQEYEFNLSSSALTLRLVDLTPDYKTINSRDIWKTVDWNIVKKLLEDYDFTKSFEYIVSDIKNNLQNPRSINRVKGIFKSMVSVKSGEVGTSKGKEKEYALNIVSKL
jgi:hypothetical protein